MAKAKKRWEGPAPKDKDNPVPDETPETTLEPPLVGIAAKADCASFVAMIDALADGKKFSVSNPQMPGPGERRFINMIDEGSHKNVAIASIFRQNGQMSVSIVVNRPALYTKLPEDFRKVASSFRVK